MLKKIWDNLEEFIIVPLIFAMSVIIFIQVIMRYVFQNSLTWSEELARYMFVWLVYFSVSFTARRQKHIRIDAAINLYPKKLRPYVEILSEVIVLAFSIFIAIHTTSTNMYFLISRNNYRTMYSIFIQFFFYFISKF